MLRVVLQALCVGFIVATLTATGCGGGNVAAPTTYKVWQAKDGTFSIKYPEDWKAEGGGKHGVQWAEFSKGNAKITIDCSTMTSLIGDITGSVGRATGLDGPLSEIDQEAADELAPVAAAHNFYLKKVQEDIPGYQEQAAFTIRAGIGDARKSEFTARQGIGTKLHGYRATALTTNKGVHILCHCTEANWKTLQPAFDEIILSLGYGGMPQ